MKTEAYSNEILALNIFRWYSLLIPYERIFRRPVQKQKPRALFFHGS